MCFLGGRWKPLRLWTGGCHIVNLTNLTEIMALWPLVVKWGIAMPCPDDFYFLCVCVYILLKSSLNWYFVKDFVYWADLTQRVLISAHHGCIISWRTCTTDTDAIVTENMTMAIKKKKKKIPYCAPIVLIPVHHHLVLFVLCNFHSFWFVYCLFFHLC